MKRIILTLVLVSIIITSFAQKTALELLNDKISYTIETEIDKYPYFGWAIFDKLVILDVSQKIIYLL